MSLDTIDTALFHAINAHRSAALAAAALALSTAGGVVGIGLATALLALWSRLRGAIEWSVITSVALAIICAQVCKHVVARPRPWQTLSDAITAGPLETSYSFPSQHATLSFAFATAIALRWPRVAWLVFPFSLAVAVARVSLGMHWPSDVLAGAALGSTIALVVDAVFRVAGASARVPAKAHRS